MDYNYMDLCLKVCDIARLAGSFIRKERETFSFSKVEYKGVQDMVSYVDKEAERIIVSKLKELIADAGFLTEEGTNGEFCKSDGYYWIIDPLDGTTNYIHGLPPYCVSIALALGDEVVVGVVYEVTLDECFYAWKDSYAYMNGTEIHASEVESLKDSLVATGMAYNSNSRMKEYLDQMDYFMRYTHGVRRIGSAAADLIYVAIGRLDAFAQFNLSPWDVAAGALIASRAGAVVSDYSGGDNYVFGKEIIASNSYIYEEFADVIRRTTIKN